MRFSFLMQQLTFIVWCRPEDFDPFSECLVPDLNIACTNRCEEISLECIISCDPQDTACISNCLRENGQCYNDCPCELNCLDGCNDCDNPVCNCQVVEDNPDWNRCIDGNSLKLGRCVHACLNNQECEDDCLSRFKTRQLDCPCEENCLAGCPCSDFECAKTTTTTTNLDVTTATVPATTTSPTGNSVLVLSNLENSNKPMIVDFKGNINVDLTFNYDNRTEIFAGCAVTFQNEFWYFGGDDDRSKRQISKIVGCEFQRQPDLDFDLEFGACNTFYEPNPIVLLCFGDRSKVNRDCHTFDGQHYQSVGSSSYSHWMTFGLANYKGQALTTGCFSQTANSTCDVKTEVMNINTMKWSNGPDFPFSLSIFQYSTASTSEAAYIIGGFYQGGDSMSEDIAEFKNDTWRRFGTMSKRRANHGSISIGNQFMIIGGYIDDSEFVETEIWNFDDAIYMVTNPTLSNTDYSLNPGLYIVPFDFCTS